MQRFLEKLWPAMFAHLRVGEKRKFDDGATDSFRVEITDITAGYVYYIFSGAAPHVYRLPLKDFVVCYKRIGK